MCANKRNILLNTLKWKLGEYPTAYCLSARNTDPAWTMKGSCASSSPIFSYSATTKPTDENVISKLNQFVYRIYSIRHEKRHADVNPEIIIHVIGFQMNQMKADNTIWFHTSSYCSNKRAIFSRMLKFAENTITPGIFIENFTEHTNRNSRCISFSAAGNCFFFLRYSKNPISKTNMFRNSIVWTE